MKRIFSLFILLFFLSDSHAQSSGMYNNVFYTGSRSYVWWSGGRFNQLILPSDTSVNKLGIASKNGVVYTGNGTKWSVLSGASSMTYPSSGIPLSTGSSWGTSIVNNSANWNTAYSWGDHSGLYPLLSGSYNNPSWLNQLAWGKITGAPSFLASESDPIYSASSWFSTTNNSANWNTSYGWGDHSGLYPLLLGSYSNPSWISQLAWSKITGAPSFLTTESDPVYSASSWFGTTNNSSNWNTAYTNRINSLTTTGSSGAATLISNVLNIPSYTLSGLGGQPALSGTGFVKISGTTISYDNSTYLTSFTETDAVVKATNGLIKSNGTTISAATAGTDYLTPTGSAASLTSFPTFNQNTTGSSAKWTTARTISITGDLSYTSPSIDGTGNVTAAGTLPTVNSNVGSFANANITVDGKGRITAASNGSGGTYPGAGIPLSTGSAWGTSITDNSTNWNTAYTNRISSLTNTGSSGVATLISNVLNIPNYTLSGLGGQPALSGTGFVKISGTTISYDNSTYLTTTGSAAGLTSFPTLNQNTTGSAATLTTGRTISISGDLTYTSPSFNGSGNITAAGTLATVNSNVGSFTNASITVDGKGRITAASNGSGSSGVTINSTTITGGVSGKVLYDNAGTVGEMDANVTSYTGLAHKDLLWYNSGTGAWNNLTIASLKTEFGTPANITGLISAGTNVTITGTGTSGSPYVINSSGGGGGLTFQQELGYAAMRLF